MVRLGVRPGPDYNSAQKGSPVFIQTRKEMAARLVAKQGGEALGMKRNTTENRSSKDEARQVFSSRKGGATDGEREQCAEQTKSGVCIPE